MAYHQGKTVQARRRRGRKKSRWQQKRKVKKDNISALSEDEQLERAFAKVLRSVSAREQSSASLRSKLILAGYPENIADSAIRRACRIGLIDDVRYAELLIRRNLLADRGLRKAEREIADLGIDIDRLEAYREYLEAGEQAQVESALRALQAHPPKSKGSKNSKGAGSFNSSNNLYGACMRRLLSRGFSVDVARQAVLRFLSGQTED